MKKITVILGLAVAVAIFAAHTPAFAAANLTGGSIGQRATDASTFGAAVCNRGDVNSNSSVPISVTVNGVAISAQSDASIPAGACSYTYLPYNSFGMAGGQTYNVQVAVNGGSGSNYSVTVPGSVLGASTISDPIRISLMAQEILLLKQLISLLQSLL